MATTTQCDNCKTLTDEAGLGWYRLFVREAPSATSDPWWPTGVKFRSTDTRDFCSPRCVSEYAALQALDPEREGT